MSEGRHNVLKEVPHIWVPMPDGRRLAARLWLPSGDAPAPAILEYLPYRKRDGTAERDASTHPVFAAEGYACIRVDLAGSGESDGVFDDEYSEQELADGEAVIAWIAAQPWCDGRIGMIGISWGGFNGLQLAYRRPPALKAVVTLCSTVDRHADDIHYMGGCLLTDNFNWGAQMTAYMSRPPDPALRGDWRRVWAERIETLPFLAADWLRRPVRDAYWRHGSVCEDWSAIQASVLAIGGWADAYVNAPLALAANLRSPRAALIGPWEHKYPHLSRILASDAHGEILGWFDRHLKTREGAPVPPARVFVQEHFATIGGPGAAYAPAAGRWVAEMAWPSPNVAERALHLSRGALGPEPGSGETAIATPLTVGRAAAYFCPGMRVDHELAGDQAEDDAASARFDTEPLAEPLEILGRPVLDIAFRVDRPVAQLVARLCDVTPGGVSQRVSYHALNLCQHAGHDRAEALEPGRLYTARLPLNTCAHRFAAGHRLRLALSTSYWPVIWPSPEAATVTLDLAECRLLLPERRVAEEPEPMAPGPARARPPSDLETVRRATGSSRRYVETDGTEVLETIDDFGASRAIAHGLETGSSVTQRYAIRPGDPLSARHEADWLFAFRRASPDGSVWTARIESHAAMTADARAFRLHRRIRAEASDGPSIEREWTETVARGYL